MVSRIERQEEASLFKLRKIVQPHKLLLARLQATRPLHRPVELAPFISTWLSGIEKIKPYASVTCPR